MYFGPDHLVWYVKFALNINIKRLWRKHKVVKLQGLRELLALTKRLLFLL